MYEELHPFVLAQVVIAVLVDGACILRSQILYLQGESLFILLAQLRLAGVCHTADTRRQHVSHRHTIPILFDVDGRDGQHTCLCRIGIGGSQVLFVSTPFATYQFQRTKAQDGPFLESGHVHTHETNGLEVTDRTDFSVVLFHRDLEQIPFDRFRAGLSIGQLRCRFAHVGNEAILVGG